VADLANLKIVVDSRDIRSATTDLNKLGTAASDAGRQADAVGNGFGKLKAVLGGLGLGFAAQQIIQIADTFSNLQGRLALVTSSMEQMNAVQTALFNMSQQTRVSYEGTVELYARLARSTESLGVSQKDVLSVTETINKALIVSGTNSQTAAGSLMQLGQAFASGTLRGDELNSVMEGMPRVAQAIAQGMGITVGELRKLGAQGKLTSEEVFNALKGMGDEITREFDKMPVTVGQSITVLQNSFMQFVGQINSSVGATEAIAKVVILLANNLDVLAAAIGVAVVGFAAMQTSMAVGAVKTYIGSIIALEKALGATNTRTAIFSAVTKLAQASMMQLTAVMAANPFVAVATAIAALSALLYANRDAQVEVGGEVVRLGDIFTGVFEVVKQAVGFAASVFRDGWAAAFATVAPGLVNVGKAFDTVLRVIGVIIRDYVNRMVGLFAGLGAAISAAINLEDPIAAFKQSFGKDYVGAIADGASKAIVQLAGIGKAANASNKSMVDLSAASGKGMGAAADAAKKASRSISEAEKETERLKKQTDDFIKSLENEIQTIGKTEKQLRELSVAKALDTAQTQDQIDAIKELSAERERLIEIQEAVAAATANVAKAEDANKAAAEAVADIQNRNKELQHQIKLIGLSGDAREEAVRAFEDEALIADMAAKGILRGNEALDEYLRLRRELAQGESAFAKDAAAARANADNLETAAGMLGQGRTASAVQNALRLQVEVKPGEFKKVSEILGAEMDKVAKGLGKAMGNALAGAQMGQQIDGLFKSIGVKSSKTGAMIGGGIGGVFGGPIGALGGAIVGGLVGGMLKKTPRAAATIEIVGGNALMAGVTGTNSKLRGVASGLANGLIKGLTGIAEQLGGALGGATTLSIGQRKDKFTVDVTGRGRTKGVPTFATEAEAIAYAMQYAIAQGAITGISAGAQALIRGSGDLGEQLQKALTFENVFKELAREKDPLTFALDELGREFAKLEGLFREAGAGAAEYAQLQELFAIRRQRAISEAERPAREKEIELLEEQGRSVEALAAQRKLELENMDASLRGIQEMIYAQQDINALREAEAAAQETLRQSYEREANTLRETASRFRQLGASLRSVSGEIDSLIGGRGNAAGSLRARFLEVSRSARLGDISALESLPDLASQLAQQVVNDAPDRLSMIRELAAIKEETDVAIAVSERQASIAELQLASLDSQVSQLIDLNETMVSVDSAIKQLVALSGGRVSSVTSTNSESVPLGVGTNQTPIFSSNDNVRQEVNNLRNDMKVVLFQIAKNTGQTSDQLKRWDGDGQPDIRESANDYY
jgi:tape measure domain-containing protein